MRTMVMAVLLALAGAAPGTAQVATAVPSMAVARAISVRRKPSARSVVSSSRRSSSTLTSVNASPITATATPITSSAYVMENVCLKMRRISARSDACV